MARVNPHHGFLSARLTGRLTDHSLSPVPDSEWVQYQYITATVQEAAIIAHYFHLVLECLTAPSILSFSVGSFEDVSSCGSLLRPKYAFGSVNVNKDGGQDSLLTVHGEHNGDRVVWQDILSQGWVRLNMSRGAQGPKSSMSAIIGHVDAARVGAARFAITITTCLPPMLALMSFNCTFRFLLSGTAAWEMIVPQDCYLAELVRWV